MILSGLIFAKGQMELTQLYIIPLLLSILKLYRKKAFQYIIIFGFLEKYHLNFSRMQDDWLLRFKPIKKAMISAHGR